MSPNSEPDFHAHYRCAHCHGLKAKTDIIFVDDKPICRIGDCKDAFYKNNHPRPVSRGSL